MARRHPLVVSIAACLFHAGLAAAQTYTFSHLTGPPTTSLGFGYADGQAEDALFSGISGIAVGSDGVVYIADTGNGLIRRLSKSGVVTTLSGSLGSPGYQDGSGGIARFNQLWGLAIAHDGTLVVADSFNRVIRTVARDGTTATLAGSPGNAGTEDGTGSAARFTGMWGITAGRDGFVYVGDSLRIRRVSPAGVVTTVASLDASLSPGTQPMPRGIAVDGTGVIYVTDVMNHVVWKVERDGVVSLFAGGVGQGDFADGVGAAARFKHPFGLAIDAAGNLYVTDASNFAVRKVTPAGVVTTIGTGAAANGQGRLAKFTTSTGIFVDADGTLVVSSAHALWRGVPTRYLAEGVSSQAFRTQVALFNPGERSTTASVAFQRTGAAPLTSVVDVPARRRITLDPGGLPGIATAEFSTTIDASEPLVVDRTVSWGSPDAPPEAHLPAYGAHAETAVRAPSLTWYLAEGATHSGMQLFYLLQNPNAVASTVRVRFLRPSGAPLEKTYTLDAQSRTNIWVNVEEFPGLGTALSSTDVSAAFEVQNDQPIIVERALYLDVPGQFFGAGHESMGVTAPAMEWFLAEGATGGFFDLFVLVANPGSSDAQVEATFLLPGGATVVKPYTVAANSRFNIWVDHEDARLADTAVSTTIRSLNDVPIIVERAMWWPEGGWYEAHNTPGATTTGIAWAVAEGELDGARGLETYLLIANTSATAATVKVTLYFEDGTTASQTFADIAPRSRFNVSVAAQFAQASGKRFSAVVESLGDTPAHIVVERAMYWNAAGQVWAAGTNALATRLR